MLNGLAIWHYPHRSMVDNIRYFAAMGLPSVSVHGAQFARALADPAVALALADAVREGGVVGHLPLWTFGKRLCFLPLELGHQTPGQRSPQGNDEKLGMRNR